MPGIDLATTDDGRLQITPSQSWLNTAFNCMEQARLEMAGDLPRVETDATAIGTAMHAGIESVLRGESSTQSGIHVALAKFTELSQSENFQWVQIKTMDTALATVERVYTVWSEEVLPQLPDTIAVEHPFDFVLHEDDEHVIRLKGSIDFLGEGYDGKPCVWDWKTANRPYEAWEKERWAIQPTAYCGALINEYGDDTYEFTYAVCMKQKGTAQLVTVTRNSQHLRWLSQQIMSIVHMIKADLPVWPLRDQHALCSDKWCPVYQSCKGQLI